MKLSVLPIEFNFFDCSELIRVQFYFIFIFLFDPSWSELIRPGLAIRVDPVQLLYLPLVNEQGTGHKSLTLIIIIIILGPYLMKEQHNEKFEHS